MIDEWLKLTTYFGERDRTAHAFVADELLDLYGRAGVRISVLLRGAAGFGHSHQLRTDRLLTLSEDLPLVSVAVDTRERIDALLDDVLAIKRKGLLTLERARMLGDALPDGERDDVKLTVYVGRQERVEGRPAFVAVCDLLQRGGVAGATALLGVDGTIDGERRRARFFARNAEVPVMIQGVGPAAVVRAAVPALRAALPRALVTVERVTVCKRDGELLARPPEVPGTDEHGLALWQKLLVYGAPSELLLRLRASGARGATVHRGLWGFHGDHPPHGDRLLVVRRAAPVVTVVIDEPARIGAAFDVIDALTPRRGLVTSEIVPALAAMPAETGARLDVARVTSPDET